jgi:hypothetical protein
VISLHLFVLRCGSESLIAATQEAEAGSWFPSRLGKVSETLPQNPNANARPGHGSSGRVLT